MSYYDKYLKYKNKYLKIKSSQTGGSQLRRVQIHTDNAQIYIDRLEKIFESNNVSPCHGIEHAKQVMAHAEKALLVGNYEISEEQKEAVLLAALLHDADDSKFFGTHTNNENLRSVLGDKSEEFVNQVVKMVEWVSSSKNGDTIPEEAIGKDWLLVPRYADRIEAIGMIGVERCFTYTLNKGHPLFTEKTPKPKTEEELWQFATEARYRSYSGNSTSMIDHFYDKLLRLSVYPISNSYFEEQCRKRIAPLIEFVLKFGRDELLTEEQIRQFISANRELDH
jgi:uncharacterized protein